MKVAVLGAGAWGTALANVLAGKGVDTCLWARKESMAREIADRRENAVYLPGVTLSENLRTTANPAGALADANVILIVIPSQHIREFLLQHRNLLPQSPVVVCASKGIELGTLNPMSVVVEEVLEGLSPRFAMLSGPSFADEVVRKMPTSVSLGCQDQALGHDLRELLSTDYFRVYTTTDYKGVELGGAVKNVVAIAAGMADGLEFGHDARAAIITRGLAEMSRLGAAMGADPRTFMGLSGMGDLVLTCTGDLSRNRQVGLKLGRGMTLEQIMADTRKVAEGVKTTKSLYDLSLRLGVELPITEQVHNIIYNGIAPEDAVRELMKRELKDELS